MGKLKKVLHKNSVWHFLGSYLFVLVIPILIITIGILGIYYNLQLQNQDANQAKMEHSVQLIDNSLSALHSMAAQGTSSTVVKRTAALNQVERETILEYKNGIDELSAILRYQEQGVGFIEECYLYFNKTNYCYYENTLYKENYFDIYLDEWGYEKRTWLKTVVDETAVASQFVSCCGKLHYIMPINVHNNQYNDGMLVFMLNTDKLISYFDYTQEIGEGILFVTDAGENILFSNDANYEAEEVQNMDFDAVRQEYEFYQLMEYTSPNRGWHYYFWITENVMTAATIKFLLFAILAEVIVIVGCIYISIQQARKMGKPIDAMFALVASEGQSGFEVKTTEKLGEIVAGIVSSNQEMQEELQESKPLLRKAFFHDLLTLDVTSTKELEYRAENAGINIHADEFWVISVRLFSNNDVYDVDEQTLEDVKVIIRSMQKRIEEILGQDVWFYQRNYLSLLILIDGQNREQIMRMVWDNYLWLQTVFSTESAWGISTKCSNIMNVWKHFEEAEEARKYCNTEQQIVEYSAQISDKHAFYFPETAEEKLINYMNAGDLKAIRDVLAILEHENLINRKLSRNGFIKLNNRICEMLSIHLGEQDSMQHIMKLNHMIVGNEEIKGGQYFAVLEKLLGEICAQSKQIKGQRRNELIDHIQEFIEENYTNPDLGLGSISIAFGISEGYVSSLFKKQTQIGFNEYVEKIRMGKAIDLLKEDNERRESIETIAVKVGYNSVQSFRRAFKRVYGTTPKNYR